MESTAVQQMEKYIVDLLHVLLITVGILSAWQCSLRDKGKQENNNEQQYLYKTGNCFVGSTEYRVQ